MKEPDTSPRWDRRSWQIDAARRALRTAARDGIPGLDDGEPNRRCRKKGLYMLLDGQLGMGQVLSSVQLLTHGLCQFIPCRYKKTLPRWHRGGLRNPGLADVLFHRGFDRALGHNRDQVRPVVGLGVQVRVEALLRYRDVRHRLGRELRRESFLHRGHAEYARGGARHRDAHTRAEVGDETSDDGVARGRVLELHVGG